MFAGCNLSSLYSRWDFFPSSFPRIYHTGARKWRYHGWMHPLCRSWIYLLEQDGSVSPYVLYKWCSAFGFACILQALHPPPHPLQNPTFQESSPNDAENLLEFSSVPSPSLLHYNTNSLTWLVNASTYKRKIKFFHHRVSNRYSLNKI